MSADLLRNLAPRQSDWVTLDATRVQAFADATDDWQFIHLDPARAAETPFGGCVAHGFLTLSMLSAMSYQIVPDLPGIETSVNYGFDKVRFVSPVPVGKRIRGRFKVAQITEGTGWIAAHWDVSVEIEGEDRPALSRFGSPGFIPQKIRPRPAINNRRERNGFGNEDRVRPLVEQVRRMVADDIAPLDAEFHAEVGKHSVW